uniref:Pentatricopeptide repeat-containing protein n=1 Tax=Ananas comosus var. bracteatus TaxID=296719 RepID=A0A6V7NQC2_ANACO|nr:unnamed protein product [Ananas comosus var. bracteatus]
MLGLLWFWEISSIKWPHNTHTYTRHTITTTLTTLHTTPQNALHSQTLLHFPPFSLLLPLPSKSKPSLSLSSHPSFLLLSLASSPRELPPLLPPLLKLGLLRHYPVQTKLLSLLSRFGLLRHASLLLSSLLADAHDDLPDELYRTLLKGFADHGPLDAALAFFAAMGAGARGVVYNFTYLLKSCGDHGDLRRGREVHALLVSHGLAADLFAMTALVNMYAKCRRVDEARRVFDGMPRRDLIAWNAMVAGYAQNGLAEAALRMAARMHEEGAGRGPIPSPSSRRCRRAPMLDP